jgi:hypothetical protein
MRAGGETSRSRAGRFLPLFLSFPLSSLLPLHAHKHTMALYDPSHPIIAYIGQSCVSPFFPLLPHFSLTVSSRDLLKQKNGELTMRGWYEQRLEPRRTQVLALCEGDVDQVDRFRRGAFPLLPLLLISVDVLTLSCTHSLQPSFPRLTSPFSSPRLFFPFFAFSLHRSSDHSPPSRRRTGRVHARREDVPRPNFRRPQDPLGRSSFSSSLLPLPLSSSFC